MFDIPYKKYGEIALTLGLFSDLHLQLDDDRNAKDGIEEALSYNCRLSFNGDNSDYIYPKDPRYTGSRDRKGSVTAKLNMDVEYQYEFFRPYVDEIDVMGVGNHETTIAKHNAYDVMRGVLALLNRDRDKNLPPIYQGAYQGYQVYNMRGGGGSGRRFTMFRHHLKGGSAPVTKGMIDLSRLSDGCDDADLYWGGHKHTAISDNGRVRRYVTQTGRLRKRIVKAVITPGYGGGAGDTTKEIDEIGIDDGWEDSHYTGTPEGWALVRVIPLHNDNDPMIRVRLEEMT